jgi:hypothetical protein
MQIQRRYKDIPTSINKNKQCIKLTDCGGEVDFSTLSSCCIGVIDGEGGLTEVEIVGESGILPST